jgi:hypothetical protein
VADKKSISMEIRADGSQARRESESVSRDVAAMKRKAEADVMRLFARGPAGGIFGSAYEKTFKGFGGDVSRSLGLNNLFGGAASGFGRLLSLGSFAFTGLFRVARFAFSGIAGGLRMMGGLIRTALTAPLRLAGTAFKAFGIAAATAAAGVYAGLKALRPASDMQQYQIQLEVLLKDPAKAKARLAELSKYAKDTNYGPAEVIESANLMEAFGIYGDDISRLKLVGDAANAFGKDIREVVQSISYLSSGRSGEAMRSLSRIGVTREKLTDYGVKFSSSGEMITEPKKAIDAVFRYFESAFGGMTARQAKTWKGAIQQLGGEVFDAFARGFKSALGPLTEFVTGNVIPMIDSIGKRLQGIKWGEALGGPLKVLGGMAEIINKIADPATQSRGLGELKGLGAGLWAGAKDALAGFGAVGTGLLKDLGGLFEDFVGEDGIGKVFALAWDGLKLAMEGGAGLFKIVLSGFSAEFLSGLKIALGAALGRDIGGEQAKRREAERIANQRVRDEWAKSDPEGYNRGRRIVRAQMDTLKGATQTGVAYAHYATGQIAAGNKPMSREEFTERRVMDALASVGPAQSPFLAAVRDKALRAAMGWDGPRDQADPMAAYSAQREKFAASLGELRQVFSSMKGGLGHTGEALSALPGRLAAGFAPVGQRLAANALDGRLRAETNRIVSAGEDYDAKAESRMRALRKAGWAMTTRDSRGRTARDPATGGLIEFETERSGGKAAEARQEYYAVASRRERARASYDAAARQSRFRQFLGVGRLRDAASERMGLKGEHKEKYWSLVDRRREDYRSSSARYDERVQAGDLAGAERVKAEWQRRNQAYHHSGGNILRQARLAAAREDGRSPQEKSLGAIENNTKGTAESSAAMRLAMQEMKKSIERMAGTLEQVLAV